MNNDKKGIENNDDSVKSKLPIQWISWIATGVIIFAIVLILLTTFFLKEYNELQYYVTIILLCFVLSTISALLFATGVKIKAKLGFMIITLVGPAAMWLASSAIFIYIFPTPKTISNEKLSDAYCDLKIKNDEESKGWMIHDKWENESGNVYKLFPKEKKNEEEFIKTMLSRVYYHGDKPNKPEDVSINTLFVNLGRKQKIKFQIIKGEKGGKKSGPVNLYMAAFPSYKPEQISNGHKPVEGHYFIRTKNKKEEDYNIIKMDPINHGNWEEVNDKFIDCLIIVIYTEDTENGDWFYVDTPKYVNDTAKIDLTVIALEKMLIPQAWEMRGSQRIDLSPAPLLFKRHEIKEVESIDKSFEESLLSWFNELISKFNSLKKNSKKFLNSVFSTINKHCSGDKKRSISFSEYLSIFNKNFKHKLSVKNKNCKNGIISVFCWEKYKGSKASNGVHIR
ncbi:MAG: hypothetical protein PVH61_37240 [Candidatus Aminicenantes bacterium]|jgi:hypothetical protein